MLYSLCAISFAMPTSTELIAAIRAGLSATGATYVAPGARDKHYGLWLFALLVDEALAAAYEVDLWGVPGGQARFRGKPSNLGAVYTYATIYGPRRNWEAHVDVNVLGRSGAPHGVDVSLSAARDGSNTMLRLDTLGLGIEAKCFGTALLDPGHGRLTLGFQAESNSAFWLVANKDNATVETMLESPIWKTRFFGMAAPGSPAETALRRAIRGQLGR